MAGCVRNPAAIITNAACFNMIFSPKTTHDKAVMWRFKMAQLQQNHSSTVHVANPAQFSEEPTST
jgi:hypothetical protein